MIKFIEVFGLLAFCITLMLMGAALCWHIVVYVPAARRQWVKRIEREVQRELDAQEPVPAWWERLVND